MPNSIHSKIAKIEHIVQSWTDATAPNLTHKSTNLIALKNVLSNCFLILKDNFNESEESALTDDIEKFLDGIIKHLSGYTQLNYYLHLVDNAHELNRLLHSFGYANHRVDKIIRDSLANRKIAEKKFIEINNISKEVNTIKQKIDENSNEIESFYEQCFVDNEESISYKTQVQQISEARDDICKDDGYLSQIRNKNTETSQLRDEILELKAELIDGDGETDSVKSQIDDLLEVLSRNQKEIGSFISEYITGSKTVEKSEDGKETATVIPSKRELIDALHKTFESHMELEKAKISDYILDFDQYKAAKKIEIEELLTAATNASLASAFATSKEEAKALRKSSEYSFFGIIFLLVVAIALTYMPFLKGAVFSDVWYVDMLKRSLFTSPFIWLAYFQAQKSKQYFRLEQEYGHKEVVSRSFEGYKAQVLELYKENSASQDMLGKLLGGSIDTIAKNPAEVLDKVKNTGHPLEGLQETPVVIKSILELIKKIKE